MKRTRWDSDSGESDDGRAKAKAAKKAAKLAKAQSASSNATKATSEVKAENDMSKFMESIVSDQPSIDESNNVDIRTNLIGRRKQNSLGPCRSVENYERVDYIDQGTYGMVFRGRCLKTNEIFALKQVKITPEESGKFGFPLTAFREINILLELSHPNIIKVREIVVGSSMDKVYMVMDYCENDLRACMRNNRQSFSTAEVMILHCVQLLLVFKSWLASL